MLCYVIFDGRGVFDAIIDFFRDQIMASLRLGDYYGCSDVFMEKLKERLIEVTDEENVHRVAAFAHNHELKR